MSLNFEQGPIRPPSEARSLLLRLTRNCPWNKCAFCYTYQGEKFSIRPLEEIKSDIRTAREIADRIRELSGKLGEGGSVSDSLVDVIYDNPRLYNDQFRSVAAWLYFGATQFSSRTPTP